MEIARMSIADAESLHQFAVEAISASDDHITACANATRDFWTDARQIAQRTLDLLFASLTATDLEGRKREAIDHIRRGALRLRNPPLWTRQLWR